MPSYQELLESAEWRSRREVILKRDNCTCQNCFNTSFLKRHKIGVIAKDTQFYKGLWIVNIDIFNPIKRQFEGFSVSEQMSHHCSSNSFIIFENKDKWLNPIFIRSLTSHEVDKYIQAKNNEIRDLWTDTYRKHGKGISKKAMGKIAFDWIMNGGEPEEVKLETEKILNKPLSEYQANEPQKWKELNIKFSSGLHVHHKYYQLNKLPWEYPDGALITLCWNCHEELHKHGTVPLLNEEGLQVDTLTVCPRCHGAGWFPEYKHVQAGVCFQCRGAKYERFIRA